jgi:mannose-6-phosphate isomerase-like protein (cupin superfamily)
MRSVSSLALLSALAFSGAAAQQDTSAFARATGTSRVRVSKNRAEQMRRRPDVVDANDLKEKSMWLARGGYVGMTVLTAADEQTTYLIVRRKTASQPEWHARWDDIVFIRSGTGTIAFGDSLSGSTLRAPGERRGGTFINSYAIVVKPGDVVRIPAAVPHAFVPASGEPLEYLVVKVRRQELPIRWTTEKDVLGTP